MRFHSLPPNLHVGSADLRVVVSSALVDLTKCTKCDAAGPSFVVCKQSHVLCHVCAKPGLRPLTVSCPICQYSVRASFGGIPVEEFKRLLVQCCCGFDGTLADMRRHFQGGLFNRRGCPYKNRADAESTQCNRATGTPPPKLGDIAEQNAGNLRAAHRAESSHADGVSGKNKDDNYDGKKTKSVSETSTRAMRKTPTPAVIAALTQALISLVATVNDLLDRHGLPERRAEAKYFDTFEEYGDAGIRQPKATASDSEEGTAVGSDLHKVSQRHSIKSNSDLMKTTNITRDSSGNTTHIFRSISAIHKAKDCAGGENHRAVEAIPVSEHRPIHQLQPQVPALVRDSVAFDIVALHREYSIFGVPVYSVWVTKTIAGIRFSARITLTKVRGTDWLGFFVKYRLDQFSPLSYPLRRQIISRLNDRAGRAFQERVYIISKNDKYLGPPIDDFGWYDLVPVESAYKHCIQYDGKVDFVIEVAPIC